VAQLDPFVIEQIVRECEHLAAGAFGSLYEVRAVCVFEFAFNLQTGGLEYLLGGARRHVVLEFDEEVFRVEDGAVGATVRQDAPCELDVAGLRKNPARLVAQGRTTARLACA